MKNEIAERALVTFFDKMNELSANDKFNRPIDLAAARKEAPDMVERFEKALMAVIRDWLDRRIESYPALFDAVLRWTEDRGFTPQGTVPEDRRDRVLLATFLKHFPDQRTTRERCDYCKQGAVPDADDGLDYAAGCDECPAESDIEAFIKAVEAEQAREAEGRHA
ncbi:MAG TPA: hypothetical protein PL193_07705 [Xanthobacteraceae bacterium]|nr:hypothetical protein [Xanthobacteraceae bacterium]